MARDLVLHRQTEGTPAASARPNRLASLADRILRSVLHLLAGVILVIPGVVMVRILITEAPRTTAADVGDQVAVVPGKISSTDLDAFRAGRSPVGSALRILAYHEIDEVADDADTVTPRQFADQMAMLAAAGYRTITGSQLRAHVLGRSLPPRSVLLTFDNTQGVWTYADKILERYGFHGVVFLTTGRVGTHRPYYLNWSELRRMYQSGRWELGSRTHAGNGSVALDSRGHPGPFLATRMWLPQLRRQETPGEFERRVRRDLVKSKADVVAHGLPAPRFFAYPSSTSRSPRPGTLAGVVVSRLVKEQFVAGLVSVTADQVVSGRQLADRQLARMVMTRSTSPRTLFERLGAVEPIQLAPMSPMRTPELWLDENMRPIEGKGPGALARSMRAGRWRGLLFGPTRTTDWSDYRASVQIRGLDPAEGGAKGTLLALVGSETEVRVSVSARWLTARVGRGDRMRTLVSRALAPAPSHQITVAVADGRIVISVDQRREAMQPLAPLMARLTHGGIGLAVSPPTAGKASPILHDLRVEPMAG